MNFASIKEKLYASAYAKELISGSFWSIVGSAISRGLIFIAWIIVGNILGSGEFGAFGLIRDTIIMFTSFAGLGLGITASKFVAEYMGYDKGKATRIIALTMQFGVIVGLLLGSLVFIFSSYITAGVINRPDLTTEFRIASIILFFCSLNGAQIGVLQGLQRFKDIASVNLWQSLLSFPFFYLGARYAGVRGAVCAFAFYNIIVCLLSHMKLSKALKEKSIKLNIKDAWNEKAILFSYSLPAFLSGVMVTPVKWLADVILFNGVNGAHEMGKFTAVYTFNLIFISVVSMMDAPFLVVMSKNRTGTGSTELNRLNVVLPWCIGVLVIMPFVFFPEVIMPLFDSTFLDSSFKLDFILVLVFTLIIMYKQGLARILAVNNMQWLGVASNLIWGVSLIVFFYFMRSLGATGLCLGYIIAYTINTLVLLPVYQYKGLIPAKTVFSWYALLVWSIVLVSIVVGLYASGYTVRVLLFLVLYPLAIYLFYRYMFRK